jgi:hypothetical protein
MLGCCCFSWMSPILLCPSAGIAFDMLIAQTSDLQLDCPSADKQLARFLARAVVDDLLPPVFVSERLAAKEDTDLVHTVIQQAVILLRLLARLLFRVMVFLFNAFVGVVA